ncbi:GyrI-like domain-containing protein [Salinibacterium sp. G-O1]|uniref:GyrI-like domain-containing protein n=1 Tax=Salinibacterium sp. G-O1 TaxID=3046208 RepID=UPI0024BA49DA|nr:GyrI-like domain-containing protein [Salinibacterium sp. G-O1]MDJ0334103.1 GyrI-like domain-containing protein [Salinibacterium sp. G-O1]
MEKGDFRRERRDLYAPPREVVAVDVPAFEFLAVDGVGDPNSSQHYVAALEALYSLSYAAKFASKASLDRDYVVGPLEGLWHSDRMESFTDRSKSEWSWTMMIRQPGWLTEEVRALALAKAEKKKLVALADVQFITLAEGTSAQLMHVGSYDDEGPAIARMHDWIAANGYALRGRHHEIYLGDPRRAAPEKLRTVLRQPFS